MNFHCKIMYIDIVVNHCVVFKLYRVCTRATVLNFVEPSVGPSTEEEEDVFPELEELISSGEISKCIGWAISLGQRDNLREDVLAIKDKLRGVMGGRKCKNWAIILYFVKQVSRCHLSQSVVLP